MLPEDEALAVLAQYCGPLGDAEWAGVDFVRYIESSSALAVHVDMIVHRPEVTSGDRADGANLRLALAAAQAVSCCRGFEPATHQSFWRLAVETLWMKRGRHTSYSNTVIFSSTAFAHVGVEWHEQFGAAPVEEFWTGLLHGTPETSFQLDAVVDRLRPYMHTGAIPPLRLSLLGISSSHPRWGLGSSRPPTPLRALTSMLRAVLKPQTSAWEVATHVGLVVEYGIHSHSPGVREILAQLARAHTHAPPHLQFSIDRLTIYSVPPKRKAINQDAGVRNRRDLWMRWGGLGDLMRTLLVNDTQRFPRVHEVELLGYSINNVQLVGAALSAVASSFPFVPKLRCHKLCDIADSREQGLGLAWLAFSLRRPCRQSPAPSLSLSLWLNDTHEIEQQTDRLEQLTACGTPLRDVVHDALRQTFASDDSKIPNLTIEWARLGSTMRLARGTRLFFKPVCRDAGCEAVTLSVATEMDLVAYSVNHGGFVGVVYAGYGLVWADLSGAISWSRVGDGYTKSHDAVRIQLRSLTVRASCKTLRLIETLSIIFGVVTPRGLAQALAVLPGLESLPLDSCTIESLAPLCSGCRRTGIVSLSLRYVGLTRAQLDDSMRDSEDEEDNFMEELVGTLTGGVAGGVLRELHVEAPRMYPKERLKLELLATAMASSALQLSRLHLNWPDSHGIWDSCATAFSPLNGVVQEDPPRVPRAVLSVLRVFGCALPEVANNVFAMARGNTVRTITWSWS